MNDQGRNKKIISLYFNRDEQNTFFINPTTLKCSWYHPYSFFVYVLAKRTDNVGGGGKGRRGHQIMGGIKELISIPQESWPTMVVHRLSS